MSAQLQSDSMSDLLRRPWRKNKPKVCFKTRREMDISERNSQEMTEHKQTAERHAGIEKQPKSNKEIKKQNIGLFWMKRGRKGHKFLRKCQFLN